VKILTICGSFRKFQDRNQNEFSSTKKPLDAHTFKILSFSSYRLLVAFLLLLKIFLEAVMHKLLDHTFKAT
jgi:hypothetical protein